MKIKAVHLNGFRGATRRVTVKFADSKPVAILFGENGTGKSSVIDAIDFACNQTFGSLEGKSLGGDKKYLHVGALTNVAKAVPSVEIETAFGTLSAKLQRDKIATTTTPAGIARPDVFVLRRSQILRLIDATPAQRFEELRSFFLTPKWTAAEAALRVAHKTKQDLFTQQSTRLEQATSTLGSLWQQNGSPGSNAETWGAGVLKQAETVSSERLQAVQALENARSRFDAACRHTRTAITQSTSASEAVETAIAAARVVESTTPGATMDLSRLLEQAKSYVAAHDTDGTCPVCTQAKDRSTLLNELAARINEFAKLAQATVEIDRNRGVVQSSAGALSSSRLTLDGALADLDAGAQALQIDDAWMDRARVLVAALRAEITPAINLDVELSELADGIRPLQDEVELIEAKRSLRQSTELQVGAIRDARSKAEEQEKLTRVLGGWLTAIEASRKEVLDAELAAMSIEVEALYAQIHPGEGKSSFNFAMKQSAVSSLDFEADFLGHKSKPVQAYFSESHLDTLGLCVFLAVAKRKGGAGAVIVLDDVLTSVDASHLDRVMDVVDVTARMVSQIIVATHYRVWRDKYRWGKASLSQTEVIEFGPWSLQSGIQVQAFHDAVTELKVLAKAVSFDRQAIASKAGIVLESMLDFLTLKFACSLPRNTRAEYTLGALANGIDTKLARVLRSEYHDPANGLARTYDLRALIDAATAVQWVRNAVGCHFNALDSLIPNSEVSQFADSVLFLSEALICGACQTLATKDKSGSEWQCRCGALHMWPLARPKD